ncbi:hypothetical protein CLOSTASPAR_02113 [[Clostridium] asparagiforme DSM 15981]|uniref:Uncharacterized protein n=1 Tax=[Clostridium] asparagiforme DSM 15981 TaxID=518636 RepID=C0CYN6_9FIRM|nr:hypothetical protein CLOSTASPAR_02113 [[Clostridium] asparagiforme DSM 15981]
MHRFGAKTAGNARSDHSAVRIPGYHAQKAKIDDKGLESRYSEM